MSEQVKRYDAVHIRYEDNNIRYGEGCEVEMVTARDYEALHAEAEALRGLTPELPPRPPEGAGLPRYGLRWNGPAQPLSVPMDDGYWTPWHLAEALLAENGRLSQQLAQSDSALRESRANDMANVRTLEDMWERHDALRQELESARAELAAIKGQEVVGGN